MVIILVASHANLDLIEAGCASGLEEVLGEELPLLVEAIAGALSTG